jgi:hypothetical protein
MAAAQRRLEGIDMTVFPRSLGSDDDVAGGRASAAPLVVHIERQRGRSGVNAIDQDKEEVTWHLRRDSP